MEPDTLGQLLFNSNGVLAKGVNVESVVELLPRIGLPREGLR